MKCIPASFWDATSTHKLSANAKLVALYLLSSPHTTAYGCFRLPLGYAVEDLGLGDEPGGRAMVAEAFGELQETGFLLRDPHSHWLAVPSILETQADLYRLRDEYQAKVPSDLRNTAFQAITAIFSTLPVPPTTPPTPIVNTVPEPVAEVASAPPAPTPTEDTTTVRKRPATKAALCSEAEAEFVAAWNETAKIMDIPPIIRFTEARQKQLRARLTDPFWREHWRAALERMRPSEFLRGAKGWKANVEWFLRPDTVTNILEGKHDNNRYADQKKSLPPDPVAEIFRQYAESKAEEEAEQARYEAEALEYDALPSAEATTIE